MLETPSKFLYSEQPCEPKRLNISLNIAGVKRYTRKIAVAVNLEAIDSSLNEISIIVSSVATDSQII